MRAGINEYLFPPLQETAAARRWKSAAPSAAGATAAAPRAAAKRSASFRAKGGCGATTLVCHVAAELGRLNHRVLLTDLDLDAGMVGLHHQDQVDVLDTGRGQQPAPAGYPLLEGAGLQRHSGSGDHLLAARAGRQAAAARRPGAAGAGLRAPPLRLDPGGPGPQPDPHGNERAGGDRRGLPGDHAGSAGAAPVQADHPNPARRRLWQRAR